MRHITRACAWAILTLTCAHAGAQYRVVGPDGRVTYTDKPQTKTQVEEQQRQSSKTRNPAASSTTPAAPSAGTGASNKPAATVATQQPTGKATNSSAVQQVLSGQYSPQQADALRSRIISSASTNDIVTGAAAQALAKLPMSSEPWPTTEDLRLSIFLEAGPLASGIRSQITSKPVVLFAATSCDACQQWQQLLQERHIPFVTFHVSSPEDFSYLNVLTGQNALPVVAVGGQVLVTPNSPRDAALVALQNTGYRGLSKLPSDFIQPSPVNLSERADAAAALFSRTPTPKR